MNMLEQYNKYAITAIRFMQDYIKKLKFAAIWTGDNINIRLEIFYF